MHGLDTWPHDLILIDYLTYINAIAVEDAVYGYGIAFCPRPKKEIFCVPFCSEPVMVGIAAEFFFTLLEHDVPCPELLMSKVFKRRTDLNAL